MFSIVVVSRAQTDFQCTRSFPHLGLVRHVYCDKFLLEKRRKPVYVEVRGQGVE